MHAKSTARQDSHHECSICCEHFGMEEQVLLSCSHVFHKQCITSFERYASLIFACSPGVHSNNEANMFVQTKRVDLWINLAVHDPDCLQAGTLLHSTVNMANKQRRPAVWLRFARSRCCPLCRTEAYQKRQVHDGKEAHKHRCAARIQAAVRGFLARKWYRQLRRHQPPSNPRLTRKWAAEQLHVSSMLSLKTFRHKLSLYASINISNTSRSTA